MKLYFLNRIKKTVLLQVLFYFILIILITLIPTSYILYNVFSSSFKDEISRFNDSMLDQLSVFSDELILKNINELALNFAMNNSKNSYLKTFFSETEINDWEAPLNVKYMLDDLLLQNRDIIDSIYVYSKSSGLCIAPQRIKYVKDEDPPFTDEYSWIEAISRSKESFLYLRTRKTRMYSNFDGVGDIITILCSYPLSASPENAQGYIAINIKEEAINRYLVVFNASRLGQMLIMDETGSVISHNDKSKLYSDISNEDFVKRVLSGKEPSSFKTSYEKTDYVVSYTQSKYNKWYYVAMIPEHMLYQKNHFVLKRIVVVCFIILLCVLILSTLFSRKLYSPIRKLLNKYEDSYSFSARVKSANEYQLLDTMFDNMAGKITNLQDTLQQNMSMIQHNFLNELLNKKLIDTAEAENVLPSIGLKFPYKFFSVAIFKVPKDILTEEGQTKFQFYRYQLINLLKSLNKQDCIFYPVDTDRSTISVIVNSPHNDLNGIKQFIDEIEVYCYTNFGFYLIAGAGSFGSSLPGIYKSNIDAKMAIQYKFMHPAQNTFYSLEIINQNINAGSIPEEYEEKFEKYLNLGDLDAVAALFASLQTHILSNNVPYHIVRKEILTLHKAYGKYLESVGLNTEEISCSDNKNEYISAENIYIFFKLFSMEIKRAFEKLSAKRSSKNTELVKAVEQYIVQNLDTELSLDSTSAAFRISSQYLSKIFKEEKKINFIDYVVSCKMEKAKKLLSNTSLTIEQISNKTGYSNAAYFSKKFKSVNGVTPSEFRQRESQRQLISEN